MLIRWAALGFILAQFLLALAAAMLLPIGWGLVTGTRGVQPLVAAALLTAATGGSLLAALPRPERALKQREALLDQIQQYIIDEHIFPYVYTLGLNMAQGPDVVQAGSEVWAQIPQYVYPGPWEDITVSN